MVSGISATNSYMSQMNIQAMQQKMFNKADSNSDGGVNQTEFDSVIVKLSERAGTSVNSEDAFSTYDINRDGALSQDEMDTFMKENAPAPPSGNNMAAGGMSMGQASGMPSPEEMFSSTDTNSDGGIDQTELEDFAATMASNTGRSLAVEDAVSTYDTDGDGVLSQDEMDSFMKESASSSASGLMQQAISAYGMGSGQNSSFADLLNQTSSGSTEKDTLNLQTEYITKMMESFGSYGGQYNYSPLDIKV